MSLPAVIPDIPIQANFDELRRLVADLQSQLTLLSQSGLVRTFSGNPPQLLGGRVASDGTLLTSTGGVTTARNSVGSYSINITDPAGAGDPWGSALPTVAGLSWRNSGIASGQFSVEFQTATGGVLTDTAFNFLILLLQ